MAENDDDGADESNPLGAPPVTLGSAVRTRDLVERMFGAADVIRIGHYELRHERGRGGMGVVYAALDTRLGRIVAIKEIREPGDVGRRRRVVREARAMAMLAHPNVVTVHDSFEVDGVAYIVMEHVDGVTLTQWLAEPRSRAQIVAAFCAAGEGLAAAHAKGLVHRDFKPESRRPSQTAPQPTNRPHSHKKGRSERGGASRRAPLCPGVDQVLAKPWQQPGPPEDRRGPPTRSPTCTRST